MSDKQKIKSITIEQLIYVVFTIIITYLSNFVVAFMASDSATLTIGDILKTSDGKYQLNFTINNFSKNKNINDIEIIIPTDISLDTISTNRPLNIDKVSSYIDNDQTSVLKIKSIATNEHITFSVDLKTLINESDITVNKNNNKISVKYRKDDTSPFKENLLYYGICSTIYLVITFIANYRRNQETKKNDEHWAKLRDESNKLFNDNTKHLLDQLNKVKEENDTLIESNAKEIASIKNFNTKSNLLYQARIRDYKKELDFWHDTLRKILYLNNYDEHTIQKIFDSISNSLETYTTKESTPSFDDIKILANILKDKDEI